MKTAVKRYFDSAEEINQRCDISHRTPESRELDTLIIRAGSALRELLACSERLDEEIYGRQKPNDLRPPQPAIDPRFIMASDVYRDYLRARFSANSADVFKTLNDAVVELVSLVVAKKRILWDPPETDGRDKAAV